MSADTWKKIEAKAAAYCRLCEMERTAGKTMLKMQKSNHTNCAVKFARMLMGMEGRKLVISFRADL